MLAGASAGHAGDFGIKTNLLYDATTTANIGFEARVAPKWSIDVSGNLNAWTPGGHSIKHWMVQPEARYWFCEATGGHFLAAHLLGGQFNFYNIKNPLGLFKHDVERLNENRRQGYGLGVGVGYGYTWLLGKHWNLEAEIAAGYIFAKYDKFNCDECSKKIDSGRTRNYFGPTKAAINLVYVF